LEQAYINDILQFWFGDGPDADVPDKQRTQLWFGENKTVDQLITIKYEHLLQAAINQELITWQATARGCLALIILLDQFSRNIYRGKAEAFAQDAMALRICEQGIIENKDQELSLIERVFFYMPMEHAEDISIQKRSIHAFQVLHDLAMPETQTIFKSFYDYALEHYRVIEQFNRFPHRNQILKRESTHSELEYLDQL
jgi:uncharacterized protein (DUF924 family)